LILFLCFLCQFSISKKQRVLKLGEDDEIERGNSDVGAGNPKQPDLLSDIYDQPHHLFICRSCLVKFWNNAME
jgi:hypothetical protein